jgi:1,4-alpha-glucan branching enzyme
LDSKPRGYLCMILHAHLPFVRHPEHEDTLQERWLFQAMTESYIPILAALSRLSLEGTPFRITFSLSPPLLEMLHDDLLIGRYKRYLLNLLDLCDKEVERLRNVPRMSDLAVMYRSRLEEILRLFLEEFDEDLPAAWRRLRRQGAVELMTTSATHAYLPLLLHEKAVAAQIKVGIRCFRERVGVEPDGFWLPECAYSPEIEDPLAEAGARYFILETHGVLCAYPRPTFGFHAPIKTPSGLYAFGRDPECSNQVWSADEGYPGDGAYREFHRDIGYDLPVDYLGAALPDGVRGPTGIKYHRVTNRKSDYKDIYDPEKAGAKARVDAGNFVFWRNKEAEYWGNATGRPPVMVAPYDAELFGHWWYEGPLWLEETLRLLSRRAQGVRTTTPGEYLDRHGDAEVVRPAPSSWGRNGYSEVWLEGSSSWVYRHLHACQEEMAAACVKYRERGGMTRRAMNQALRELLLAQSSDWPFIMASGTMPDYAEKRLRLHIGRFRALLSQLDRGEVDAEFLAEIEARDNIFPKIEFEVFTGNSESAAPGLLAGGSPSQ